MLIPHHHEIVHIELPPDVVSRNLIENLHLRWNYGLIQVEEFVDDDERAVCVVTGAAATSIGTLVLIVRLVAVAAEETMVIVRVTLPSMSGYPYKRLVNLNNSEERPSPDTLKATADVLRFCQVAHGEDLGFADVTRRVVELTSNPANRKSKRKYRK